MSEFLVDFLESLVLNYIALALFTGIEFATICVWVWVKTKNAENKFIKIAFRAIICSLLIGIWSYFIVYRAAYPISLAYYECNNDLTYEIVGVIDRIEQPQKDVLEITVDNNTYRMVYGSAKAHYYFKNGISEGNTVRLKIGNRSNYILDACKVDIQE